MYFRRIFLIFVVLLQVSPGDSRYYHWPNCGKPGTPANHKMFYFGETRNDFAYICKPGFVLVGRMNRDCNMTSMTWTPYELPKCVTNLLFFKKNISQVNISLNLENLVNESAKRSPYVKTSSPFEIGIDLGRIVEFTDIKFILWHIRNLGSLRLLSSNVSNSTHATRDWTYTLQFSTNALGDPKRLEKARHIFMESMNEEAKEFTIYDIQIYNSFESMGCGLPDVPENAILLSTSDNDSYVYECRIGYDLFGNSETHCINGQWTFSLPKCKRNMMDLNKTSIMTPTSSSARFTTKPYIIIGVTSGFAVLALIVVIAVFSIKKSYRKNYQVIYKRAE